MRNLVIYMVLKDFYNLEKNINSVDDDFINEILENLNLDRFELFNKNSICYRKIQMNNEIENLDDQEFKELTTFTNLEKIKEWFINLTEKW